VKYVPKELPEGVNAPRTNALAEVGLLAGTLVAVLVGTFYALGFAADWLAVRISPEVERTIGERFPVRDAGVAPADGRERAILDALLAHVPHEGYDVQLRVLCDQAG
jgi:hypothetical protein